MELIPMAQLKKPCPTGTIAPCVGMRGCGLGNGSGRGNGPGDGGPGGGGLSGLGVGTVAICQERRPESYIPSPRRRQTTCQCADLVWANWDSQNPQIAVLAGVAR